MDKRSVRILIIDNTPHNIKTIIRMLEQLGYQVKVETNFEEGKKNLNQHWWHLALVDKRLADDKNTNDISGVTLIQESDPINRRFIFTDFKDFKTMQMGVGSSTFIDGYLEKSDDPEINIEKINNFLYKKSGINWNLEVDFDGPMTFSCMAAWFQKQDKDKVSFLNCDLEELTTELTDLWSLLFPDETKVTVYSNPQGNSDTISLRVKPHCGDEEEALVMVKTGLRKDIRVESDRYDRFVKDKLIASYSTQKRKFVETLHFGAICYSFVGVDLAETERFADFYRAEDEKNISEAIVQLFDIVFSPWYAGQCPPSSEGLDDFYRNELMNLSSIGKRDRLEKRLKELVEKAPSLGIKVEGTEENRRFKFSNDLWIDVKTLKQWIDETPSMMSNPELLKGYTISTTHGDLNGGNILVDNSNRTWLIDFARTDQKYRLRDFAELESVIAMDLRRQNDIRALMEFERIVFRQGRWDTEFILGQENFSSLLSADQVKALKILNVLRGIAGRHERDEGDLRRYYVALFFEAVFRLMSDEHDSPAQPSRLWQQIHALIRIATIIKDLER